MTWIQRNEFAPAHVIVWINFEYVFVLWVSVRVVAASYVNVHGVAVVWLSLVFVTANAYSHIAQHIHSSSIRNRYLYCRWRERCWIYYEVFLDVQKLRQQRLVWFQMSISISIFFLGFVELYVVLKKYSKENIFYNLVIWTKSKLNLPNTMCQYFFLFTLLFSNQMLQNDDEIQMSKRLKHEHISINVFSWPFLMVFEFQIKKN